MAEPEFKNGITDVPLPPVSGEGEGSLPEELPDTPAGWAERLSSLDFYKDHKKSIAVLGAAALVVGVGVYAKRHGAGKVFVGYADRHAEQAGVISLGEVVEYGAAIAVPTRSEDPAQTGTGKRVQAASKLLFAMTGQPGEVVRPSGDPEQASKYNAVATRAAGWLKEHLLSQTEETK
jgi:hypothetical protein